MADELNTDIETGGDAGGDAGGNADLNAGGGADDPNGAAAAGAEGEGEETDADLEEAARLAAEQAKQDGAAEKTGDEKKDAGDESDTGDEAAETAKPKSVAEAQERISVLESQNANLQKVQDKVLEIGGLPMLEMAQPVIDVLLNPEAKAADILGAVAELAPHHDAQSLAWKLVDENAESIVADKFGDEITPDVLQQLVDGYKEGKYELDQAEGEEDDAFLSPKERAERARERDRQATEKARVKGEKEARTAQLETERTNANNGLATLLHKTVDEALEPFAVTKDDTPQMKGLKELVSRSIHAITMLELSNDPAFKRAQGLIKANGFKAADALGKGALSLRTSDRAAHLARLFQPLFTGTVAQAKKAATKIQTVRQEPSGTAGAGDMGRKEISAKDPNWRKDLDAEYEAKIRDLPKSQARNQRGQFA